MRRSASKSMFVRVGAALLLTALLASACGSDKKSATDTTTKDTTGTTKADALGTPKKATGTPVKVGFFSDGKHEAIDNTAEVTAAKVGVQYANEYLGGIGGHPIDLVVCEGHNVPADTTACANQMIADKVVAVLSGTSGQAGAFAKGIAASGIPTVWFGTLDSTATTTPGNFILTNGLAATFAGPAAVANEEKAKQASEIVIDVPAAVEPVKKQAAPIYQKLGIGYDVLAIPAATADMTPQMQTTLSKKPDFVHIIGNDTFCISALKALKTLGYTKTIVIIPQCIGASTAQSVPGGLEGMKLMTSYSTDTSDKEVALYLAANKKFGSMTEAEALGNVAPGGWIAVVGFARAVSGLSGEATSATVKSTFASAGDKPLPLAEGVTFNCDGKQVKDQPNICSAGALVATLDAAGKGKSYKAVDLSVLDK